MWADVWSANWLGGESFPNVYVGQIVTVYTWSIWQSFLSVTLNKAGKK